MSDRIIYGTYERTGSTVKIRFPIKERITSVLTHNRATAMTKDCKCQTETFDCETLKPGDICLTREGKEAEYIGKSSKGEMPYIFHIYRVKYLNTDRQGIHGVDFPECNDDIIRKKPAEGEGL